MKTEIGSYEAKTKLPELLRKVKEGHSFTITNRGEPVAELIPAREAASKRRKEAVERLREFMRESPVYGVNIKELIEEGRD